METYIVPDAHWECVGALIFAASIQYPLLSEGLEAISTVEKIIGLMFGGLFTTFIFITILIFTHILWFKKGRLHKILALIIFGPFFVIAAIIIQCISKTLVSNKRNILT